MSVGFLKFYKVLCITVFFLILLGGSVRAMNAGLACPDWPLCFGDYIPDFHPTVYFEFMHRFLAGLVGLAVLVLNGRLIINTNLKMATRVLSFGAILLLAGQVILGALTVLWMLKAEIVIWHLGMGTGLLLCLCWISFAIHEDQAAPPINENVPTPIQWLAAIFFVVVYGQVLLGGAVASNYASLACTGFPLCNGEWVPSLVGAVGIHVIHRLGAYFTVSVGLVFYLIVMFKIKKGTEFRRRVVQLFHLLLVQVGVGAANVLANIPPLLTVIHLGVGVLLMIISLRLLYLSRVRAFKEVLEHSTSVRSERRIAGSLEC